MTVFYLDGDLAADTGDGSAGSPWKDLSHLRAQTGNDHVFYLVGDFRNQTFGTNSQIEYGGTGWQVLGTTRDGLKPKAGMTAAFWSAVNITSVTIAAGLATVVTSAAHGVGGNSGVVLVAGITGGAAIANGYWVVTVVNATTYTFVLTGTETSAGEGTSLQTMHHLPCVRILNTRTGAILKDLDIARTRYAVQTTGSSGGALTGFEAWRIDASYTGDHAFANSWASDGARFLYCTVSFAINDAFNFSGSSPYNTDYEVGWCVGSDLGFNPDGSASVSGGAGDFSTNHSGNYGDTHDFVVRRCLKGAVTHVNTTGTSRAWNGYFEYCRDNGIHQNSGGTLIVFNVRGVAHSDITLTSSTTHALITFSNGSGGEVYNSTFVTAKGTIASFTTACVCWSNRGTGTVLVKNLVCVSDGSAPIAYIAGGGTTTQTTNGYSHTGTLFYNAGNKTLAQFDPGGLSVYTIAAGTAPTSALADWKMVGDKKTGTDLSGVGQSELLTDEAGVARPTGSPWDLGALVRRSSAHDFIGVGVGIT